VISQQPRTIVLPPSGILALESRHDADFRMDIQYHSFHEVFLLLRGTVVVRLNRPAIDTLGTTGTPEAKSEERHLQPGDYLVVPAGLGHFIKDTRASTLVLIACTDHALDTVPGRREVWQQIVGTTGLPAPIRSAPLHLRDPSWRELIALSRPAPHDCSASGRLELESAFSRFLLELKRLARRPRFPDARERVHALARMLPGHAHEAWTLDRAAGEVHLSRRRFSELWRSATGETFITSLQRHRINTAQQLMLDEELSIAGAAFAAGFDDITHFYRVFRKQTGAPPGAWLSAAASFPASEPLRADGVR
jgi:AraC-like DNA-binding protein/mannose-6-phosphate isomerase-like protein (cupin superfamily)